MYVKAIDTATFIPSHPIIRKGIKGLKFSEPNLYTGKGSLPWSSLVASGESAIIETGDPDKPVDNLREVL